METESAIRQVILDVLAQNNAITLATTGGEYSPWLLTAYFTSDDLTIYLMLETSGKTMANLKRNSEAALLISQNDAMKDFLQAQCDVVLLPDTETERVMTMLKTKMPWYQLYTPCVAARLDVKKWFVSSFSRQWFPAKVLKTKPVSFSNL
jgi:general stress protein 26